MLLPSAPLYKAGWLAFYVTVPSPRPLAGEGLGVRVVDSTADSLTLTLTLSLLAGGEGTE